MENYHDDIISFTEFNDKINSFLFDTDQQVKIFQNLEKELLFRDMKVVSNKENLADIWKIYNTFLFHEEKINNSISVSDFCLKQITNIVDNLEQSGIFCGGDCITNVRVPIYCILERLFISICHMKEVVESIWIDENFTCGKYDDPVKSTKYLLNKQYNILEDIQNKLDLMEKQIKDIQTIKCSFPYQN